MSSGDDNEVEEVENGGPLTRSPWEDPREKDRETWRPGREEAYSRVSVVTDLRSGRGRDRVS